MVDFLLKWLVLSAAFWGTAQLLPGIRLRDWKSAAIVSAIYALLAFVVGKLLFVIFTIGTLGIAYLLAVVTWWIIGAIILVITDKVSSRLEIDGFKWALIASALISVLTGVGYWVVGALLG